MEKKENKKLDIHQKLLILQEKITVKKGQRNDFAKFNYRDINDIIDEIKPVLKELKCIIFFPRRVMEGNQLTINLTFRDTESSDFIEFISDITIDRNKSKMDESQKCLSAGTFLKKSLLEDLLLLNEGEDPDGHDNTNKTNNNSSYKNNKTISKAQIDRFYSIAKDKDLDSDWIDKCVKLIYNITSKKDWKKEDYSKFTDFMEKNKTTDIIDMLQAKFVKLKKQIPEIPIKGK
jgi:hypothetical protein